MQYMAVRRYHENPDWPMMVYSELDQRRRERRKVEVFADGRAHFAGPQSRSGNTYLGDMPRPPLDEIASDTQFDPTAIEAEEFDDAWRLAGLQHSDYMRSAGGHLARSKRAAKCCVGAALGFYALIVLLVMAADASGGVLLLLIPIAIVAVPSVLFLLISSVCHAWPIMLESAAVWGWLLLAAIVSLPIIICLVVLLSLM